MATEEAIRKNKSQRQKSEAGRSQRNGEDQKAGRKFCQDGYVVQKTSRDFRHRSQK